MIVWLTGLPGSGKTTIAYGLARRLKAQCNCVYVLDGDELREGLNADLSFCLNDRSESVRRTAHVAKNMMQNKAIVICALITPRAIDRAHARSIVAPTPFVEVFIDADLGTCRSRDPKGLFARADAGDISSFTGVGSYKDSIYERPTNPDVLLCTSTQTAQESISELGQYLENYIAS